MAVINTNISATVTSNALSRNERSLEATMERLSTGKRINSAADDAAGLAISSKLTSQIRGLDQAARNGNDAISMIQTADGAAIEIGNMLQRMRELAVQATNGTNTDSDITNLNTEFSALADEIDRIVDATEWNGMAILDGSAGDDADGKIEFQIGANDSQTISVDFADFNLADGSDTTAAAAVYTSAIDTSDYGSGDTIVANGVTYTVTGSETDNTQLVAALNASTDTGVAAYTYSGTTTLVMTADATGAVSTDPTSVGTLTASTAETTAGDATTEAVYTSTIDTSDYATGDVITANGVSYTVTGSETDNTELVAALNASTDTGAAAYTYSGTTTLVMTADATGAVSTDPTTVLVTADVTTEDTAGVTATSGVLGADLSGAMSDTGTIDTETADIITTLDTAIAGLASQRATFGAAINRLEYAVDNLMNVSQNTEASRSRIEDADYAVETTELARAQIIAQAGTAMLSQANQQAQSVLALLK